MSAWKYKSLDELGFLGRGKSRHRPRNAEFLYGGPYPFIQTSDVKNANFRITEYSQTYSDAGLSQSKLWPINTLCITIAANIADTGILGVEACFPDSIMGFIPKDGKSDVRFIKYCFDLLQRKIKQISQGAAQDNLSLEKLLTIKFFVPDYPTQRRIASILSAYDDLIENNLKRIKLLEELAQRTYEEWFVKFRINGEPLPIDEKTGLPVGWEYRKLGFFFNVVTGKKDANYGTPDGQYPFFTCSQEPIKSPGYSFDSAAILLAGNGEFNVKIYRGKFEAYQRTYVLIPEENKDLLLLYRSIYTGLNRLTGGSKGAVIKYLTKDMIQNFEITYPSNRILEKFNSILDPLQFQLESLQAQNRHLRESRDILLPRLMSGKINVE